MLKMEQKHKRVKLFDDKTHYGDRIHAFVCTKCDANHTLDSSMHDKNHVCGCGYKHRILFKGLDWTW